MLFIEELALRQIRLKALFWKDSRSTHRKLMIQNTRFGKEEKKQKKNEE
jgi:hypothetical protein